MAREIVKTLRPRRPVDLAARRRPHSTLLFFLGDRFFGPLLKSPASGAAPMPITEAFPALTD
jgi:hypothetical protein